MSVELSTRRQEREHRTVHRRQRFEQRDRLRTQRLRRRQRMAIPRQIEALPAFLEEGVEAHIVVAGRRANLAFAHESERLVAYDLPVLAELREFGQLLHVDERLRGHRREQIHQRVVRRHDRRMILELAHERVPHAAAQMHVQRGGNEEINDDELGREERPEHLRHR